MKNERPALPSELPIPAEDWERAPTSVRSALSDTLGVNHIKNYAPYGGLLQPVPLGFGFTGEWQDNNGLYYLRARYYSPALGVFPNLDPVEGNVEQIMSLNRYSYVAGNPTNFVDPSGTIAENPGTECQLKRQNQDCEFTECHARYLAHAALSEASGVSRCAMVALVLSQLNYYEYSKQVAPVPNYPGSFVTLEAIASGAFTPRVVQEESYTAFMAACQQNPSFDLPTFEVSSYPPQVSPNRPSSP